MSAKRILHLQSSFDAGGKELRSVRLINAFGRDFTHDIVSAQPGAFAAAAHVSQDVSVAYPEKFPPLAGFPGLGRLKRLAEAMRGYDLILSYNWGAMDAVMAHTLYVAAFGLAPLIHHEDGFNADEAERLKPQRNLYRRLALGRSTGLVVPSRGLERIALEVWHQPRSRVHRIANGIATAGYAKQPLRDVLPNLVKRNDEFWLGTLAGLRAVKDLPAMVRAFASLPAEWQLVILGEGPERAAIEAEAIRLKVAHRVHLPGFAADPAKVVGLFDIFALSSKSEQFPISVVEAMAAGLPVVAPAVGDVAEMVAAENARFIVPPGDENALAQAFETLSADPAERRKIGRANREKARESYDEARMIARYRALYTAAIEGAASR
ncbi:MAG: glycosyltransferase [Candidatus Andeanibacterium colombiense]|uniref:Glycosyltransferase n=1 Tax=Candidatus Andeanibacterium colombiense TaxID=3121345 RepID=A0AAJ5XAD0_9SPHN|nr:MAG: glycosyltransferase [Sphingomonadaceae bacterium]